MVPRRTSEEIIWPRQKEKKNKNGKKEKSHDFLKENEGNIERESDVSKDGDRMT